MTLLCQKGTFRGSLGALSTWITDPLIDGRW